MLRLSKHDVLLTSQTASLPIRAVMNPFDYHLIEFTNQFARKSPFFDSLVNLFAANNLLKGGVVATLIWFLWFYHPVCNQAHA